MSDDSEEIPFKRQKKIREHHRLKKNKFSQTIIRSGSPLESLYPRVCSFHESAVSDRVASDHGDLGKGNHCFTSTSGEEVDSFDSIFVPN